MPYFATIASWLENWMLPCLFRAVFSFPCPGCGFQRSVILLVSGDVGGSVTMYWSTIPILLMFIFLLAHLQFRFPQGNRILIFLYAFNGILILSQYIYTISKHL